MASRPLPRRVLLSALVLLVAACAAAGFPSDHDAGDAAVDRAPTRPEVAFVSATQVLPVASPVRCAEEQGDLADLTFTWTPSGERRVYAGVFSARPSLERDESGAYAIAPVDAAVWAWTTGGDRTDAGSLAWRKGFTPGADGLPDLTKPPPAELPAGVYWFVTWAWNDARELAWSSETRPFFWAPDAGADLTAFCAELDDEAAPDDTAWWCVPTPEQGVSPEIQCQGFDAPVATDGGV